jgi:hypothetical protein
MPGKHSYRRARNWSDETSASVDLTTGWHTTGGDACEGNSFSCSSRRRCTYYVPTSSLFGSIAARMVLQFRYLRRLIKPLPGKSAGLLPTKVWTIWRDVPMTSLYNCISVAFFRSFQPRKLRSQLTSSSSVAKCGMTEQIKYCCFTVNTKYTLKLRFEEHRAPAGFQHRAWDGRRVWHVWYRRELHTRFRAEKQIGRHSWIILKWIPKKWAGRARTR